MSEDSQEKGLGFVQAKYHMPGQEVPENREPDVDYWRLSRADLVKH